ncbi:MAG: S-layer homology domain-containing protein [bacterium]
MKAFAWCAVLVFVLFALSPAVGAPLFGDVPQSHWAKDAIMQLASKGLLEGYPDGTFKGDRLTSRWEMAIVVARLMARVEQMGSKYFSRADMDTLKALAESYKDELTSYGVRMDSVEDNFSKLDTRTSSLEKIRFYGYFDSIMLSQDVVGDQPLIGTTDNLFAAMDWTCGRPLVRGKSVTGLLALGLNTTLSSSLSAGVQFDAYQSLGDLPIDIYWGVTPPYQCNLFTGSGFPEDVLVPRAPMTRMVLDNFWFKHEPSKTLLLGGAYRPQMVESFVLNGMRNPNANAPSLLPFWGASISGPIAGKFPLSWEILETRLPHTANSVMGTKYDYASWAGALNLTADFKTFKVGLNFSRAVDDPINSGNPQAAGIIPIPVGAWNAALIPFAPGWEDSRSGAIRAATGPQSENTIGGSVELPLSEFWKFRMEIAGSTYIPDTARAAKSGFDTSVSGSLLSAAVSGKIYERFNLNLSYLDIAPTYDPFLNQLPAAAAIPVFLPYSTYYSSYYQLHDYLAYPNNRRGPKLVIGYEIPKDKGNLSLTLSSLDQAEPSTPGQWHKAGNVEPLFGLLAGGGTEKGHLQEATFRGNYNITQRLRADFGYTNYKILRSAGAMDDINFEQNLYSLALSYPFSSHLAVYGSLNVLAYKGQWGQAPTITNIQDFTQSIPSLGVSYIFDESSSVSMSYRTLGYTDNRSQAIKNLWPTTAGNWQGQQTSLEFKFSF